MYKTEHMHIHSCLITPRYRNNLISVYSESTAKLICKNINCQRKVS